MNFRQAPMLRNGRWSEPVEKIAAVLGALPDDLFSPEQLSLEVNSNRRDYFLSHDDMMRLADSRPDPALLAEDIIDAEQLADFFDDLLDVLPDRSRRVLELRYGLNGNDEHSLDEVAEEFDVSRERIRQIESKGLRLLRKSEPSEKIAAALGLARNPDPELERDKRYRDPRPPFESAEPYTPPLDPNRDRRPAFAMICDCGVFWDSRESWGVHRCMPQKATKRAEIGRAFLTQPVGIIQHILAWYVIGYDVAFRFAHELLISMPGYDKAEHVALIVARGNKFDAMRDYFAALNHKGKSS
jgi:RNA polymerase sigma factor (sigma-70 family)